MGGNYNLYEAKGPDSPMVGDEEERDTFPELHCAYLLNTQIAFLQGISLRFNDLDHMPISFWRSLLLVKPRDFNPLTSVWEYLL